MINLTQLLFPETAAVRHNWAGDRGALGAEPDSEGAMRFVVDWEADGALDPEEACAVVADLAALKVSMLMISGWDPQEGLGVLDIVRCATSLGMRVSVAVKAKLISATVAQWLKGLGVSYVSARIEGPETVHDYVTGIDGAYATLMQSIRNCKAEGLRFNLVFNLGKRTWQYLPHVFEVIEREHIPRLVVAHQVYASSEGQHLDPSPAQSRQIMDKLLEQAIAYRVQGRDFELYTVDNYADAIYAYLKTCQWDRDRAARMWQTLSRSEGNPAGVMQAAIDSRGFVLPDAHTPYYTFGNVHEQPFSEIWTKAKHPVLLGLRTRKVLLTGRCAQCRWLSICNGNSRTRAEAVTGDFWAADPQCYLTDAEIAPEG